MGTGEFPRPWCMRLCKSCSPHDFVLTKVQNKAISFSFFSYVFFKSGNKNHIQIWIFALHGCPSQSSIPGVSIQLCLETSSPGGVWGLQHWGKKRKENADVRFEWKWRLQEAPVAVRHHPKVPEGAVLIGGLEDEQPFISHLVFPAFSTQISAPNSFVHPCNEASDLLICLFLLLICPSADVGFVICLLQVNVSLILLWSTMRS